MSGMVRKTGLNELLGEAKKKTPEKTAARAKGAAALNLCYVSVRRAGKNCRGAVKGDYAEIYGIPREIMDSLLELDGILDRMDSYGSDDGFSEDVKYNECYFDVGRACDLVAGINYRLNRLSAGGKKASEQDKKRIKEINRIYGLTAVLEENLKTLKDSLDREYGLAPREMGMGPASYKKRPEDV